MYKPKPKTLACLGGSNDWMLQSGLFKVHWFLNPVQMQKHSWEVQGQITVPAVLSLPKGEVGFTSPGFLWIMKSCPLLPRVKLLAKCDSVGGSSLLHLVCWVSFPIFPSWKSPGLGGTRDRNALWGAHSCEQMAELRFFPFLAAVTSGISSLSCMWHHPKQQIHLWQCSVVMALF